jgi:hypothetical protein
MSPYILVAVIRRGVYVGLVRHVHAATVGQSGLSCDDEGVTDPAEPKPEQPSSRDRRRPRPSLEEVFGDVLPDQTGDERAPEPGRPSSDTWYEDNRPPHHDRD